MEASELGAGPGPARRTVVSAARAEDEIAAVRVARPWVSEYLDVLDRRAALAGYASGGQRVANGGRSLGQPANVRRDEVARRSRSEEEPVAAPGDVSEHGPEAGIADGIDECVQAVRYQIKHGAKVIKIMATAGVLSFEDSVGAQQLSFEEMKAICEEAARHGRKVAAHAHGTEGIKAAIRAGVASIEHGSLLDDEAIQMMIERGVFAPVEIIARAE